MSLPAASDMLAPSKGGQKGTKHGEKGSFRLNRAACLYDGGLRLDKWEISAEGARVAHAVPRRLDQDV